MEYRTPEQRRKDRELAYHRACFEQYSEAARRLEKFPRMQRRALDNAEFHRRHLPIARAQSGGAA